MSDELAIALFGLYNIGGFLLATKLATAITDLIFAIIDA